MTITTNRSGAIDPFAASRLSGRRSGDSLQLGKRVSCLRDRLEARADARAAGRLQADVREARAHVKGWNEGQVSQNTTNRYQRVVGEMRSSGTTPEAAACKASFEFKRAALVHCARSELKQNLRALDTARRGGDADRAADAYAGVRAGLEILRRYPPSTGERARDLERISAYAGPARAAADRSNSKRASIDSLPSDWKDRVQREARPGDRAALAAMSLTGCRPVEVRGIKARQSDTTLALTVSGAKYDQDRGVASRTLFFDKGELNQSGAGRDLQRWLGNRECRTVAYESSIEAFRERISRAAKRAGFEQVSCYSFRHDEARELKSEGVDKSEIAARLGHRSERSQSVYG